MQVFNSFQEMAVGTGALCTQGTMSVFNAFQIKDGKPVEIGALPEGAQETTFDEIGAISDVRGIMKQYDDEQLSPLAAANKIAPYVKEIDRQTLISTIQGGTGSSSGAALILAELGLRKRDNSWMR